MKTHLAIVAGICSLVGLLVGGIWQLDLRHASADDMRDLVQRVAANEKAQLRRDIQAEIYFLRSQLRKYPNDEELRDQLERALRDLKSLDKS